MTISTIPALVKLLFIFILIMVCIRKKLSLGNTFLFVSIILGIVFEMALSDIFTSCVHAMLYPKTLALSIIVSLILVLSNSMETSGEMQTLLGSFKGVIKHPKLKIILFPALIGLLPMPGGAVFSAPMVKELGAGADYRPASLSFINYWFRHIWEYWWPMYPGVLLVTVLANISLPVFMTFMSPFTVLAVVIGFYKLKRPKGDDAITDDTWVPRVSIRPFLKHSLPILIVIIPGLALGGAVSYLMPSLSVAKELGLISALFMAIGWVWVSGRFSYAAIRSVLLKKQMLMMIYMIFTILIFKGILEDSHAVHMITEELEALRVPLAIITAVLPFLVGLVTGITIAVVGSAFPILIPLIQIIDPQGSLPAYMMLAMISGFTGVLLSPVHLCLILSNEYFGTTLGRVYRHLMLPCGIMLTFGFAYFLLLV